ncbi:hypothetical protein [Pararhodonellum marinum]|uniref:hypothetical protein n=1 Tax=Pararhodonellum marinum TaxID=2755358 RepID=UPI00188F20AE|nr:hypothetical protein [Pararhodonellum marinum]
MKKLMFLGIALLMTLSACDGPNNKITADESDDLRDNQPGSEEVSDAFRPSYEDLEDRQKDLRDDLNQLKAEKPARTNSRTETKFDQQFSAIERQVDELGMKAQAFRSAEENVQEGSLQRDFEKMEEEIKTRINAFKDEFEPNQD